MGTGTAFDAQNQFLANIEDAINSSVDLPSQIARYQNTLKYARSKVDFVYGIGLYMSPSIMELRIGTIQDYNNKIVIANEGEGLTLGLNDEANTVPIPPRSTSTVEGTKTKQSLPEPDPTPSYRKQVQDYAKMHNLPQSWVDRFSADSAEFERWLAERSMAKKYTKINAGQVGNKTFQINHCQMNTPAVNNTKQYNYTDCRWYCFRPYCFNHLRDLLM